MERRGKINRLRQVAPPFADKTIKKQANLSLILPQRPNAVFALAQYAFRLSFRSVPMQAW